MKSPREIAEAIMRRAMVTPLEGAQIYASSLVPGDRIDDETDECIIGKFRHLLPAVLRERGMDLVETDVAGMWLVVSYQRPMVPRAWMPLQRVKAVA